MLCLCQGPHWQPWSGSSAFSAQGQPFLARCHEPEFQAKSGHPVFKSTHILLLQLPHVYTFLKASLSEGELLCSSMAYLIQGSATHKWLRLQLEWPSPKPDSCAELFLVWMDADGVPALLLAFVPTELPGAEGQHGVSPTLSMRTRGFPLQGLSVQDGSQKGTMQCMFVCISRWGGLGVLSWNPTKKQL